MQLSNIVEKIKQKDWSPTIFYVMLFLFILAFTLAANAYDYDLWARLIVGKHVIQTGDVLRADFLSYTETIPWFDHEWGSGVIFYLTYKYFSHVGFVILQALLTFLLFFTISKTIKLRGVKTTTPYNFLFYMFTSFAFIYLFDQIIRCQMFTFLFFAIFLYILELARAGKNGPLYVLPAIMLVWNNMHAGCVAGLGLIIIYIIGELINRKPASKYILPFIFSLLVLPINPWAFAYLKFLFMATTMNRHLIGEWQNIFVEGFTEFKIYIVFLLLVELLSSIKSIRSKTFSFDATKFLVLLSTLLLAILHVKHIPFAVIAFCVFVYDDFYTLFNQLTNNLFNRIAKPKNFIVYFLILIYASLNIRSKNFEPLVEPFRYPITLIEFLKINNIKGNLATDYALGSFVAYKLYPNIKIYMDGRYEEVYPEYTLENLLTFLRGIFYEVVFINYPQTDILILDKYVPAYKMTKKSPKWVEVYDDGIRGLFIKKEKAKKHYKKPSTDLNYYKKTMFDTNIDFKNQEKK